MRVARFYIPGAVHHVISRLVDRRFFLDLEGAREKYLALLGRSIARSDWRILGYALMSNHIHLVTVAGEQPLEDWTKRVHAPFGTWLNKVHAGLGPIFAARPRLRIVPDNRFAWVLAYVHNNPVRAGLATRAAQSSWTSHLAYVGRAAIPQWLHVAEGLRRSGCEGQPDEFDRRVHETVADTGDDPESDVLLQQAARRVKGHGGAEIATPVVCAVKHVPILVRRGSLARPSPQTVIEVVARVAGVPPMTVVGRTPASRELRRLVLVVGASLGIRAAELSAALGFTRQYGSRLMSSMEGVDLELFHEAQQQLWKLIEFASVDGGSSVPSQVGGKFALRKRGG